MLDTGKLTRAAAAALLLMSATVCVVAQKKAGVRPEERRAPAIIGGAGTTPTAAAAASSPAATNEVAVRYAYEFEQPEFVVRHIVIEHDAAGRGRITFERKDESEAISEPLTLSPAALKRVTELWEALRFLESEANYQSEKQFPHLGTARLKMTRGARERRAEFNWTNDRNASDLVNEYRRIADQALFIFDINLARENQPLNSPKILSRLEMLLKRNAVSDPHQLVPLLRDLSIDERLPLIARNHAGRLLKKIEK